MAVRITTFWIAWVLGTLALAFAWLFGHVPKASGLILGAADFVALVLLLLVILIGKSAWQTVKNTTAGLELELPRTSMKIITVIACIQVLICLLWIVDLVIYELRN